MKTTFNKVCIEPPGYILPPELIRSADIEECLDEVYRRLNLPKGRLEMMTGIRERRLFPRCFKPSDAAIEAGKDALTRSSVSKKDISCLIMCSVCRDFLEPATSTVVHHALGLPGDCIVFDISNACLGVLSGMIVIANMIESGQIKAGILVSGETSRSLLESTIKKMLEDKSLTRKTIKPYFSSLTIGSGAVGVILAHNDLVPDARKFIGGATFAATEFNNLCTSDQDRGMADNLDTLMNTDSETLMIRGIETAEITWKKFKEDTGWNEQSPELICTHQVGKAHKKMLLDRLGLPESKDFETLSILGNTGSASCPVTYAMAVEKGLAPKGSKTVLLGIGSGINCTMLGIE